MENEWVIDGEVARVFIRVCQVPLRKAYAGNIIRRPSLPNAVSMVTLEQGPTTRKNDWRK